MGNHSLFFYRFHHGWKDNVDRNNGVVRDLFNLTKFELKHLP